MRPIYLDRLLEHEGFREKPYQCSEGVWTFGHGLTFITEDESEQIVETRCREFEIRLLHSHGDWLYESPPEIVGVLVEMCYQLGWSGCHSFKMMFEYLWIGDYDAAADAMLDSKWYRQTPERCEQLSEIVRNANADSQPV